MDVGRVPGLVELIRMRGERSLLSTSSLLYLKAIVKETSVVAAKIDAAGRPQPSFRLPLRTKIELHFYGRWKETQASPSVSCYDFVAEEVTKSVYHQVTGRHAPSLSYCDKEGSV